MLYTTPMQDLSLGWNVGFPISHRTLVELSKDSTRRTPVAAVDGGCGKIYILYTTPMQDSSLGCNVGFPISHGTLVK